MYLVFTKHFKKCYKCLPDLIKNKFNKQIGLLMQNYQHPSLHTKRMRGHKYIWEGRVDIHYRFTFQIEKETIIFRKIGSHDILRNP